MTDQSRQVLPPEFRKASAKLILNPDGTFVASELPEELHPVAPYEMKPRIRLNSGSGAWKIASWDGAQHLQLEFHALTDEKSGDGPYGFPLIISRGWSTIELNYALGDADQGQRIEFEKK